MAQPKTQSLTQKLKKFPQGDPEKLNSWEYVAEKGIDVKTSLYSWSQKAMFMHLIFNLYWCVTLLTRSSKVISAGDCNDER